MKCVILSVGKQKDGITDDLISTYTTRILRYTPMEWAYIAHDTTKERESEKILAFLKKEDYVILLDEKGSNLTSEAFAELIENRMVDSVKRVVFIIGGAYGVTEEVFARANYVWKLSALVFPHMLVRGILAEQLYRAFTIINGEKYHHQ
jgi:23S rRNA (pseudouridine1915-N3)-methyltransferase